MDGRGSTGTGGLILDRHFLGLAMMEFWERFAVAGVKSLLVLILADQIFGGDLSRTFGARTLREMLEHWFGPLSSTGLASQTYGYASALLYLSVPLGGLAGDLLIGRRAAVFLGGGAMLAGLALMLRLAGFLPGLVLFTAGAGMLKGNLSAQVGGLFPDEAARQRGYAAYLGFLNAGVICGPLVCGGLAALAGWAYAIGAAALAVAIGLAGYALVAPGAPAPAVVSEARRSDPPRPAGLRPAMLLVTAILSIYCCYSAYDQLSDIFLLWARSRIELRLGGWEMPVAWFLSLDGLFTLLLILASQILFPWLERHGIPPSAHRNILLGSLFCGAGYLVLALAGAAWGGDRLSLGWALAYILLIDIAIVLIWPGGLSLIAAVAPPRFLGFWMGLFYLHGFFAALWVGISGSYYGRIPEVRFWLLQVAMAGAGALLALAATALRASGDHHLGMREGAGEGLRQRRIGDENVDLR